MLTSSIEKILKWSSLKITPRYFATLNQPDLKSIKKELEKYPGGSVDLIKDDNAGVAVLMINNPERKNSLSGTMMVEMAERVSQLEKWPQGKGLILAGKDGSFCSGADLNLVKQIFHYGAELAALQHDTLTRLHNLPLISVALLQGHTLGGGAELSTACDFRVMSSAGKIGFVQIRMGVTTGWGATTRLVNLLGRKKTLQLLSSAKIMNSKDAFQEGLVDYVLPQSLSHAEELEECKKWLISNYCKFNADLLQAVKASTVYADLNKDILKSLEFERETFAKFWGGPAQIASLAANIKHK